MTRFTNQELRQLRATTRSAEAFNQRVEKLTTARQVALTTCTKYNAQATSNQGYQPAILETLGMTIGADPYLEPNFHCTYGFNTVLGDSVFANHDVTIDDTALITIGNHVNIAPRVGLFATIPVTDPHKRRAGLIKSAPITIKDGVWLGGNVVVYGGVTIGENTIVGAGAVVTHDLPANVVAVGNPARVIRPLKTDNNINQASQTEMKNEGKNSND